MPSGLNAFEISDIQETQTDAGPPERSGCNNVTLRRKPTHGLFADHNCDKFDQGSVTDELLRYPFESWRTLELSAANRAYSPVDRGGKGSILVPDEVKQGELVAFTSSSAVLDFEAQSDAEFVLGSAVPHNHDLVLGSHSVHTSVEALREAEARISEIHTRLVGQGRL